MLFGVILTHFAAINLMVLTHVGMARLSWPGWLGYILQRYYSMLSQVSTKMGGHLWVYHLGTYLLCNQAIQANSTWPSLHG